MSRRDFSALPGARSGEGSFQPRSKQRPWPPNPPKLLFTADEVIE